MTNATLIRTAASAALIVMTLLGRSTPVTAADPGRVAPAVQILGDKAAQFIPLGVSSLLGAYAIWSLLEIARVRG